MNGKKKRRLAKLLMIVVSFIYVFLNDWQGVEYILLALPVIIGVLESNGSSDKKEDEVKDSSYYEKRLYTGELREDLKNKKKNLIISIRMKNRRRHLK